VSYVSNPCQTSDRELDLTCVQPLHTIAATSCSRCDGWTVVPIVYGLPNGDLIDAAGRGEIMLGGCIVGPQEWACLDCGYTWPLPVETLESEIICNALYLAHRVHRDERRVKRAIEVAHLLFEAGYEPHVIAAGLLCEAVGAGFEADQIADEVGAPAAALVELVTEHPKIREHDRRRLELRARIGRAGGRAAAIFAADRLVTLREAREHSMLTVSELRNLERDVRMLSRANQAVPFVVDLQEELARHS
jgi:HD domain